MSNTKITSPHFEFVTVRRNLILVLTAIIATATVLILIFSAGSPTLFEDVLRSASAGVAAILALVVVCRQGLDGLFGKAYTALAIGISLWFAAEMIWTFYEVVLGIENPFPSLADPLWLAGYVPFLYFMFKTYRMFTGTVKLSRVILVSSLASILFALYIYQASIASDLSTTSRVVQFLISIAYPLGDLIFIVPSLLIILNSGRGELTSIPWIFLAMLVTAAADSVFGYTSVANIAADQIWNPIYIAGYLLFAAGLYWYNRFFIVTRGSLKQLRH